MKHFALGGYRILDVMHTECGGPGAESFCYFPGIELLLRSNVCRPAVETTGNQALLDFNNDDPIISPDMKMMHVARSLEKARTRLQPIGSVLLGQNAGSAYRYRYLIPVLMNMGSIDELFVVPD